MNVKSALVNHPLQSLDFVSAVAGKTNVDIHAVRLGHIKHIIFITSNVLSKPLGVDTNM